MKIGRVLVCAALCAGAAVCAAAPEEWRTEKSTHFIVYYKSAPGDFVSRITENAEYSYNSIADDLGLTRFNFWLWEERAQIYIYDSAEEYQSATGKPAWVGGDTSPSEKVIRTYVYAPHFFESVLPHEMGHIIYRELVGFMNFAVPRWLEEGVATHQEKSQYAGSKPALQNAIREGTFIPLAELENTGPQILFSNDAAQMFYMEAYSIVDFLLTQYGKDAFVTFSQNLRDKKNLPRAVASAYPFGTLAELDRTWQEYLKR